MKMEQKEVFYKNAVDYFDNNQITLTDCAKIFKMDRKLLSVLVKRTGTKINPHGKQEIDSFIFNKIDTEEKAYWLGFLAADGYVGRKNEVELSLALKDENHLIKFNNFLKKSKTIKKDSFRVRCGFKDIQIFNDLNKLGVIPRKSLVLKFPSYEQVPKKLMSHYIRGYNDGDGSIFITNNNINISILGTKEFLEALVLETSLPKRNLYKNRKDSKSNCWFFQYSGKNALLFIDYLYKDSSVFLERKYAKYLEFCRTKK